MLLVERKIRKKSFLKFKKIKLIHKKLKNVNSILNSTQLNNIISYILKNNISLFFINTLTLAHFSFLLLKYLNVSDLISLINSASKFLLSSFTSIIL